MHRPHFEYETENRLLGEDALEEGDLFDKYTKMFDETTKSGILFEPANDHPDWKWTILWEGFKNFSDYRRRAKYCNPDLFEMYIYNDFEGWGLMELMENMV
jgi:hypothetical protein